MASMTISIPRGDELSAARKAQLMEDLAKSPVRKLTKEEREIYGKAIIKSVQWIPAFRDALALMRPYMDATAPTAYTDPHARVGLGYWFFYILNDAQRASVILHECMHVLNNHFQRREEIGSLKASPQLFNIAGDFEINTVLHSVRFVDLSEGQLPDRAPNNYPPMKTMEYYADLLAKDAKKAEENCEACQQEKQDKQDKKDGKDQDKSKPGDKSEDKDAGADPSDEGDSDGDGAKQPGDEGDEDGAGASSDQGDAGDSGDGDQGDSGDGQPDPNATGPATQPGDGKGEGESDQPGDGNGSGQGQKPGKPSHSCGKDGEGEGEGDGEGQGQGNGSGKGKGQQGQGSGKNADGQGNGGWNCGNSDEETEAAADEAGIQKASDVEVTIAKQNTAARIVEERNSGGRGTGTNNEFWDSILKYLTPAKVDWRKIFRRIVASSVDSITKGRSDYTYRRVSRRLQSRDFVFPGMLSYLPKIALAVDTSGSMGNEDFQRALIEIEGILKEVARGKDSVSIFSVDTKASNIAPVTSVKKVRFQGGGGTVMAVAWQYVNSLPKPKQPDIMILCTDGYIDWADVEQEVIHSKFKSVICVTQQAGFQSAPESLRRRIPVLDISTES
jgi:predicted metal-dependent peptidase